ncbi:Hsp70 family protein [Dactylosporangium sucinum]|uniref:Hsp70 protein n=1 Tax=Dactylosporangium sucinum TaxID=1424081 RepID=A0A917X7A5_9ACTN|nr:Hsp70 family protein [Dactylosporangium sucinum]GGM89498.1 hypothetical protein GCM10007977_109400 [Dactylosporangium sucinum]
MNATGHRLGIDLGTSNTVAALAEPGGRVRPLLFDGSPLLPSAVFADGGPLLVGADAVRAAVAAPAGLEANPKRRIDDGTVWLGEREYPVTQLLAAVLSRVAAEAERVAGEAVTDVVLTHPAAWQRTRLGVLSAAVEQAGLGPARFVPEPVAAAAYFATVLGHRVRPEGAIVVYDLGAGTFDVSVVRQSAPLTGVSAAPGGFEVVAADGLTDVGGLDLDALVVKHARAATAAARDAWQRLDWPQDLEDQLARQGLWQSARALKEQLSRHPQGDLHVPLANAAIHLTREEFEKAAEEQLSRTAALTRRVLQSAGVPPEDVAGVFLVGGSSRIPLVATLLHRSLRIAPTIIDQPELVVAEGSLHAATAPSPSPAPPTPPAVAPPPPVTAPLPASPPPVAAAAVAPPSVVPSPVAQPPLQPLWPQDTQPTAPPPRPRRRRSAAVVLAIAGAALYTLGVAVAANIAGSPAYENDNRFTGVEEVVVTLLLLATPGAFLLAVGLNLTFRTPALRALGWIVAGLALAVVPLAWLPYWTHGQGVFLPVVAGIGVAGALYGLVNLPRALRSPRDNA